MLRWKRLQRLQPWIEKALASPFSFLGVSRTFDTAGEFGCS
jgi:hypothetical protein